VFAAKKRVTGVVLSGRGNLKNGLGLPQRKKGGRGGLKEIAEAKWVNRDANLV